MNRFETYKKNYDEAVASIKSKIDVDSEIIKQYPEYKEAAVLCKFLFECTDVDLYGYVCHKNFGSSFCTDAQAFEVLCSTIYHAIIDDGDICYPVVDDRPRIAFISRYEAELKDCCFEWEIDQIKSTREVLRSIGVEKGDEISLTFLKDAYEFIETVKK